MYILYYIPQLAFKGSLLAIKIFNDLVFYSLLILIFFTTKKITRNNLSSLASVLFFILITGVEFEGHAGYYEYYSLIFIGSCVYILQNKNSPSALLVCGLCLGLSILVTPSVLLIVLFIFTYVCIKFLKEKNKIFYFFIGLFFPIGSIFVIYQIFNESKILLENFLVLPYLYKSEIGFFVFQRFIEFFFFVIKQNKLILLGAVNLIVFILIINKFLKLKNLRNLFQFDYFIYLLISISLFTFVIANKGYWHHVIYFYYFFAISIAFFIDKLQLKKLIYINFSILFPIFFTTSLMNVINFDSEKNYPIYSVYQNISNEYKINSALALGDHLILYYFNLQNESFIIHPSGHEYEWLLEYFKSQDYISDSELYDILDSGPDLIICNKNFKNIGLFCEKVNKNVRYNIYDQNKVGSSIFIKNNTKSN